MFVEKSSVSTRKRIKELKAENEKLKTEIGRQNDRIDILNYDLAHENRRFNSTKKVYQHWKVREQALRKDRVGAADQPDMEIERTM